MIPIRKVLRLPKDQYYRVHLSLVNALLPIQLTPKEIEVLAGFMSLDGDISRDRFGTSAKKIIKEKLNITDGGLGNYMKSLKDKGFLLFDENGKLMVRPFLQNDEKEQIYNFKLISE